MDVLFDRVAGLDVGKDSVTVCLRVPGKRGRHKETRTFKTTFGSLQVMRDWLVENGVMIAAMESTSTYWKGPYYCLEDVMAVWLLNAAHMKAVPGRKSDVRDAEWIAQLLEHGLLSPSFVPPPPIRRLRILTRYRMQLHGDRTRDTIRLELMLEDATIKLSSVASSLNTVSARAMLTAMIDGETDPLKLADLARGPMRRKIPDLAQALTGTFDANHAQLAKTMLLRLRLVEQAQADLDATIAEACRPWQHQIELLQTIPGVGEKVAQVIIAETGADMSRFPTAGAVGGVGRVGAGDARVRRETQPGRETAREQVVVGDAGRGRRFGRPDARQELSRRPARSADPAAWHETGPGRGGALDPGRRVSHAVSRRAVPRSRRRLAPEAQHRGPHPPTRRPTREARPQGRPRPGSLTDEPSPPAPAQSTDAAATCPSEGHSRVCK